MSVEFEIRNGVLERVYDVNGEEIIYVPDNVKIIESRAFHNLSIHEVFVPDTVEQIKDRAFLWCSSLEKISISEKTKKQAFLLNSGSPEIEIRKKTVVAKPPETDYKQLFLDLAYINELPEKENVLDSIYDDDVKIPFAVYLFNSYESEKAKEYISGNFQKVMHYLVDKKDMDGINAVMSIVNKECTAKNRNVINAVTPIKNKEKII